MAAPTDADLKYYAGTNGNPTTDAAAVGGAIDTGAPLNEATANNLIHSPVQSASDQSFRGIAYRKNESGGTLNAARFRNRCAGNPPAAQGVAQLSSTSSADTGKCWLAYKHSGAWILVGEEIQMAGTAPVNGLVTIDANSDFVLIYLPGVPSGDITMTVAGEKVAHLYGSLGGNGNFCATSLFQVALATAQDATISASNRLNDPASGIGAFSRASFWPGLDNSLAVPGTNLGAGKWIGYCAKLLIPAGMPKPPNGQLQADFDLFGDPVP